VLHSLAAMILLRKSTGEETISQQGPLLAYKIKRICLAPQDSGPMLVAYSGCIAQIKHYSLAGARTRDLADDLPTPARVQAHRLSSLLPLHEGVPRAMDHHSSGCLPVEKFPTFASGWQGRGPVRFLGFRHHFHLTRPRDVARGRITGIRGWICATSSLD
jgi:hypothetical protein